MLRPGTGKISPRTQDFVFFYAIGRRQDGTVVQNTFASPEPTRLQVTKLIPIWQEALAGMVPGEQRRFWFPAALALKNPATGVQEAVVFDLELVSVLRTPDPPSALKAPDSKAKQVGLGVSALTVKPGKGGPKAGRRAAQLHRLERARPGAGLVGRRGAVDALPARPGHDLVRRLRRRDDGRRGPPLLDHGRAQRGLSRCWQRRARFRARELSTRQGFRWWEIDLPFYVLKLLSWVGLVSDLKGPTPEVLRGEKRLPRPAVEREARQLVQGFTLAEIAAIAARVARELGRACQMLIQAVSVELLKLTPATA